MCTGTPLDAVLLPVALSGAGMVLQRNAADSAADKQQNIINRAGEESARLNSKKANTIENFAANTFDPTSRDQRYEDAATKNEGSLTDALLSANGGAEGEVNAGATGNLSNDYLRSKATSTASATEDILKRAKLMARQNAGGLMYNDESLKAGGLASDVLGINSEGRRNNSATRAALSNIRDDGSLLGGLLMAGGGALAKFKGAGSAADLSPSASYGGILGMSK